MVILILGCYGTLLYNDIVCGNGNLIALSFFTLILGNLITPITLVSASVLMNMQKKTFSRLSIVAILFLLYHMLSSFYIFTFGLSGVIDILHNQLVLALRITGDSLIAVLNFYLWCAMRQLKTLAELRDIS